MTATSPDLVILRWLAGRENASAVAIGEGCRVAPGDVRARLASLESRRLVVGRQDAGAKPPRRLYSVTAEGRRMAGPT